MESGGARALRKRIARRRAAKEHARRLKEASGQQGEEHAASPVDRARAEGPGPDEDERGRTEGEHERRRAELGIRAQPGDLQPLAEIGRLRTECERLRRLHAALVEDRKHARDRALAKLRELQTALGEAVGRVATHERQLAEERDALAKAAAELALRRRRLRLLRDGQRRRAADAAAALASREDAIRGREEIVRERADALAAHEDALLGRERALARREETLRAQEEAVRARERALEEREQARPRPAAPADERAVREAGRAASDADSAAGLGERTRHRGSVTPPYNVFSLGALVDERSHDFPERVEEWHAYLVHLKEFADGRGILPASFNGLVGEVFGDLLAGRGRGATGRRP